MVDFTPRILAGRYEVGELIGRGGMAEVHVGRDARLGRTVAIKVLRSDLARDPAFQNRFRREAQAAASLNHPAIVAVYDTGEDAATDPLGQAVRIPYIIMEYVEGHTLRELMRDGAALPIDEAIDITIGVLSALQYAHHAGIVHRDIKPANIMLTAAGQVKVMDFGIARALADSSATMTQSQAVIGTAQYLSPEQARGELVDARSDLYSTGCVLYELLTGRPPFIGDSAVAVAYQHVREIAPPPSTLAPDVPDVLDRIVLKGLAKDRDLRYSTASEFRGDLETAKRGGVVAAPAVVSGPLVPTSAQDPTQVMTAAPTVPAVRPMVPSVPRPVVGAQNAEPSPFPIIPESSVPDEDEATRRKRWTIIAVVAAILVIGIALIIFAMVKSDDGGNRPSSPPPSSPPPQSASVAETVRVPELTDPMTYTQAEIAIKGSGLKPEKVEQASDDYLEGQVIRFNPEAGEEVPADSTVQVFVSSGPGQVKVPDNLAGMDQRQARAAIKAAGLVDGITLDPTTSPTIPEGDLVDTNPKAGELVEKNSTVDLILSNGKTKVPNVKGKSQADAETRLRNAGLTIGDTIEVLSDQEPGTVLAQSVKAKETVSQGTPVTLTVARAAIMTVVPNILNLTEDNAIKELAKKNLTNVKTDYQYHEQVEKGKVIDSDPRPGEDIREGKRVTLIVSQGPAPLPTAPVVSTPPTEPYTELPVP